MEQQLVPLWSEILGTQRVWSLANNQITTRPLITILRQNSYCRLTNGQSISDLLLQVKMIKFVI